MWHFKLNTVALTCWGLNKMATFLQITILYTSCTDIFCILINIQWFLWVLFIRNQQKKIKELKTVNIEILAIPFLHYEIHIQIKWYQLHYLSIDTLSIRFYHISLVCTPCNSFCIFSHLHHQAISNFPQEPRLIRIDLKANHISSWLMRVKVWEGDQIRWCIRNCVKNTDKLTLGFHAINILILK